MSDDTTHMVKGSSHSGDSLGSVPLITFMSEMEKTTYERVTGVKNEMLTWRHKHELAHQREHENITAAIAARWEARSHEANQWRTSHERSHDVEQQERDRALEAIDKRLEQMNELRDQINRERAVYVARAEMSLAMDQINKQIDTVGDRILRIELAMSNLQGRIAMLGIGLTILMFLIGLGASFIGE